MDATVRIERALDAAISRGEGPDTPPGLAAALRYAVFPGGARIRPKLCLAVAMACADDRPEVSDAAAVAVELMHCASLVHDDMPCFDDAATRRGKASVHRAFGEPLALLTGDALIVMAFEALGHAAGVGADRLPLLLTTLGRSVGTPSGIVAGQAWECEQRLDLAAYQRAKTGALFAGATAMGAVAAGACPDSWRAFGERLGEAYQVADDIHDVAADPQTLGKPTGRDVALDRPSVARELGLEGAVKRLQDMVGIAVAAIPASPRADDLRRLVLHEARRFLPKELAQRAA